MGLGKPDVGKAHGSTALVVKKAATEDRQTGSSSKTPHVATEYGLYVSTKCVTFALDKDAKSDREDQQLEGCEKEEKASDS